MRGSDMTLPSTPANPSDPSGSRPVPDPTVLTTDQLLREIGHLKELLAEMFDSVNDQLALGERQRVEQKSDTEKAIQAALTAQKEAVAAQAAAFAESVAKSENATAKQLDQMQATFKAEIGSVATSHNELKDRVVVIEATRAGAHEQRAEHRAVTSGQIAALGAAIALGALIIGLLVYLGGRT